MITDFLIKGFSRPVSDLPDTPDLSPGKLKEHFDSNSYELLESLNGLIGELAGENGIDGLKVSGKSINDILKTISQTLETKVNKEEGKTLSSNDYTTKEKQKLESLYNYDDTGLKNEVASLKAKDEQLSHSLSDKVDNQAGKGLSTNDYTDFEKTKIRLVDYRDIDEFLEDGFYIVYEEGPGMYDKYWTLYPLIQTSMFTGEETEYTQVRYTEYGASRRISYGTADNYGAWERNDIVKVRDSLTSSEKDAALSANMGKVLNETKADLDKWELIDTITTTEDVASVIISKEPDGTPYNFKKMKVFITMPSGGNSNAYFNMVKRGTNGMDNNSSVAYYLLTHTKAYADFFIEGGLGFVKTRSGVGEYSQYTNASSGVPMDYFYELRINGNGKILTGTRFEIWGVRNK